MQKKEIKTIMSFCHLRQNKLRDMLYHWLKNKYDTPIYFDKKFIMAKGNIPITLIAHMDTVFSSPPDNIFYDKENSILWSPEGLGADDRAGIYAIVTLIKKGYRPNIIFTTDEEQGALGAQALVKKYPNCPFETNYVIQLDKRGKNYCVFYDCANSDFTNYISNFGFMEYPGSYTDISIICPAWKIAGVNLSVGYENEHSKTEYLQVNYLLKTISKVEKMLNEKDIPFFRYIPRQKIKRVLLNNDTEYCYCCGNRFFKHELIEVPFDGDLIYMCPDCCYSNHLFLDNLGVKY